LEEIHHDERCDWIMETVIDDTASSSEAIEPVLLE
jgi:hypothetical protein